METQTKSVRIELTYSEWEDLEAAAASAGSDDDGNPVFDLYVDGEHQGAVTFHEGTEATDLTE